ncbi:hypothetical protein M407DRAFT_19407 [Tulasnella calospora MUT 4182]|uniref:Uncharacterized protein n=1 Tax=Tulasnella calospora MUT 4182 TaxID=1051891 RepID=A0A0C3LCM7_9AGAM|nr:hypothetical protein M407DRAFT_19407 [Tulasnella calospora MUT 4182]
MVAKLLQECKEQELQSQQLRQLQVQQQAARLLSIQREKPHLAPSNPLSSGLGGELGAAGSNALQLILSPPNNERELNQVVRAVVTLSDQAQILQKQPSEKRVIFRPLDLNNYKNVLTTFLMRINWLQEEAIARQNQPNIAFNTPSSPAELVVRTWVMCDHCDKTVKGTRYKCNDCPLAPMDPQVPQAGAKRFPGKRILGETRIASVMGRSQLLHSLQWKQAWSLEKRAKD